LAENDNQTRLFRGLSKQIEAHEKAKQAEAAQTAPTAQENAAKRQTAQRSEPRVIPLRTLPDALPAEPQIWTNEKKERRIRWKPILLTVLLLLAAAAVIAAVRWVAVTDIDGMKRSYTYRGVRRSDAGVTDTQALQAEQTTAVSSMNRRVVTASKLGLQVQDEDGLLLASCVAKLENPVLCVSQKVALVYDAEGRTLCAVSASMKTQTLTTDTPLLAADVSEGGGYCYLTGTDDGKTVLTVCSENFSEIFQWFSRTRYLQSAVLSDDGQTVAVVGAGAKDGVYWSSLLLLRTDSETPTADVDLGQRLVLWTDWVGDVCCLICREDVLFYDTAGKLLGSYTPGDRTITGAAAVDGCLALSLSAGRTGDRDALVILSSDGSVQSEKTLGRSVEQLSAAGDYLAVRTPQGVSLFTARLETYGEVTDSGDLQAAYARPDGSVLLVNGQGVALYLP